MSEQSHMTSQRDTQDGIPKLCSLDFKYHRGRDSAEGRASPVTAIALATSTVHPTLTTTATPYRSVWDRIGSDARCANTRRRRVRHALRLVILLA